MRYSIFRFLRDSRELLRADATENFGSQANKLRQNCRLAAYETLHETVVTPATDFDAD